ncbi:MAG: response regulator [Bacteroidetes bacterium]|nr:response regulator [Bacteroidota bacterium]
MNILVVDESKTVREALIRYLEIEKYFDIVFEVDTVEEAKRIVRSIKIEVVLLDIQLHDQSGLDLVTYCNNSYHKPIVILCSNYGMPQYKNVYEKLSINHFFDKSSEQSELKRFIKKLAADNKNNLKHAVS